MVYQTTFMVLILNSGLILLLVFYSWKQIMGDWLVDVKLLKIEKRVIHFFDPIITLYIYLKFGFDNSNIWQNKELTANNT